MTPITFNELHDRMTDAGVYVGVDGRGRALAITLSDPDSLRAIRFPVGRLGFDRAATALVLSTLIADVMGTPRAGGLRGSWPEFLQLWEGATR